MRRLYNPEGFQPEQILPAHLKRYADHTRAFIHQLYVRRVTHRRDVDDFVQLKAAYLMKTVLPQRHYREILSVLEVRNVIEVDRHFIVGVKARGYRLGDEWRGRTHRIHDVNLPPAKRWPLQLPVHEYLRSLLDRITAEGDYSGLDDVTANALDAVKNCRFFSVCEYGRCHTNLTNLKKEGRAFLRVDDQKLVNLDVANCQPLLLGLLTCNQLGLTPGEQQIHRVNTKQHKPPSSHHTLRTTYDSTLPTDLSLYLDLTEAGRFYHHLADMTGFTLQEVKERTFGEWLFCRKHRMYTLGKLLERHFPTVTNAIVSLKGRDFRQASRLLQQQEARLIIEGVCSRLMNEFPAVWVATIHDSLLVRPDDAGLVCRVMREEFGRVDLSPTIRIEAL